MFVLLIRMYLPSLIAIEETLLKRKVAIAAGPVVYGFEGIDNPGLGQYTISNNTALQMMYEPDLLNGINIINGTTTNADNQPVSFTAIPFYCFGNRQTLSPYEVW